MLEIGAGDLVATRLTLPLLPTATSTSGKSSAPALCSTVGTRPLHGVEGGRRRSRSGRRRCRPRVTLRLLWVSV